MCIHNLFVSKNKIFKNFKTEGVFFPRYNNIMVCNCKCIYFYLQFKSRTDYWTSLRTTVWKPRIIHTLKNIFIRNKRIITINRCPK